MKILAIVCVLILAIGILLIGSATSEVMKTAVTLQTQPVSAMDIVMRSRETPPIAPEPTNRWAAIAFPLLALVVVGCVIGFLFYGERFLKQWRLLTKKDKPRPAAYLPPQPDWNQVPGTRPITSLPAPQERGHEPY